MTAGAAVRDVTIRYRVEADKGNAATYKGIAKGSKEVGAAIEKEARATTAALEKENLKYWTKVSKGIDQSLKDRKRADREAERSGIALEASLNKASQKWVENNRKAAEKFAADQERAHARAAAVSRQASLRMAEAYKGAASGALALAKGIALTGALGAKENENLLRTIVAVEAGFQTIRGAVDLYINISKGVHAYQRSLEAATAARVALTAAESAGAFTGGGAARGAGGSGRIVSGVAAGGAQAGAAGTTGAVAAGASLSTVATAAAAVVVVLVQLAAVAYGLVKLWDFIDVTGKRATKEVMDKFLKSMEERERAEQRAIKAIDAASAHREKITALNDKARASQVRTDSGRQNIADMQDLLERSRRGEEITPDDISNARKKGLLRERSNQSTAAEQALLAEKADIARRIARAEAFAFADPETARFDRKALDEQRKSVNEKLEAIYEERDKLAEDSAQNQADITRREIDLKKQLLDETKRLIETEKSRLQSAKERFASLDPFKRQAAVDAKEKLDRGEELGSHEIELLRGLGLFSEKLAPALDKLIERLGAGTLFRDTEKKIAGQEAKAIEIKNEIKSKTESLITLDISTEELKEKIEKMLLGTIKGQREAVDKIYERIREELTRQNMREDAKRQAEQRARDASS